MGLIERTALNKKIKILIIVSSDYRSYLTSFKQVLLSIVKNEQQYDISFALSTGIDEPTIKKKEQEYAYILVSCAATAALICPEGITFTSAAGSFYKNKFLILSALDHIYTLPHGKFLLHRQLAKIFAPEIFLPLPPFTWGRARSHEEFLEALKLARESSLIAVDIETTSKNLAITCLGFSLFHPTLGIKTFVLDCEDDFFISRMRQILAVPAPKIFQNGLYDNSYLLRFNAPAHNWIFDTMYFFHAWYSELPRDLGFLAAFFLRDFEYWKQEGQKAKTKEEYHAYNAKDCYATLCIALAQIKEAPPWAKKNFTINFPQVFPCLLTNLHGVSANKERLEEARISASAILAKEEKSLQNVTGISDFNAGSPKQVTALLKCFGHFGGSSEKELEDLKRKSPILEILVSKILRAREQKKALSTYFAPRLLSERVLYSLNPAGTQTGRFSCKESAFWCGLQIQNFPPYAKRYVQADPGFSLIEIDNSQSETRCTAYLAQDTNLIRTVESGKDFHSMNAALFFGADYEKVKIKIDGKDSPLRALAKRINHAVSYNMMAGMFVKQAGYANMEMARKELKIVAHATHEEIAQFLIGIFDKTYPRVRNEFQQEVIRDISFTNKLTGPTGWTRYFFTLPSANKHALNMAIAHGPQSLSVHILNRGFLEIYKELACGKGKVSSFRLLAQIHDSIFFQCKEGREEEFVGKVQELLTCRVLVHGKTLIIPTEAKVYGKFWAE